MKKVIIITIIFLLPFLYFLKANRIPDTQRGVVHTDSGIQVVSTPQSPISIDYLRSQDIVGSPLIIEEDYQDGLNYRQYIASYRSEGNKVYGLLAVPEGEVPDGGWPAVVFNHGYIPPKQYVTTERYIAYVDYLARNGFVVFKIDFRGNGNSEGQATGSYFSSGYTIDAINAVKALQTFEEVNPKRIGMWGHSMAGNATLRAMEVSSDIKAGVIWAGAVYSYADFAKYGIADRSFVRRPTPMSGSSEGGEMAAEIQKIRSDPKSIDFSSPFWKSISLTKNLQYLKAPVQIHHAVDDATVNINYSRDLTGELKKAGKKYEFYEYDGGGHNIESPYFETAMGRTVEFFKKYL